MSLSTDPWKMRRETYLLPLRLFPCPAGIAGGRTEPLLERAKPTRAWRCHQCAGCSDLLTPKPRLCCSSCEHFAAVLLNFHPEQFLRRSKGHCMWFLCIWGVRVEVYSKTENTNRKKSSTLARKIRAERGGYWAGFRKDSEKATNL